MNAEPDYRTGDDAATNDGRVIAWGLADLAHEQRTANLIAYLDLMTREFGNPDKVRHLNGIILERLGLCDEEDRHVDQ